MSENGRSELSMGDAFGPRSRPTGRAALRLAGIAASIITASACSPAIRHDYKADEITPATYRTILGGAPYEAQQCRQMLRGFMADNKITYGELERLNDCDASAANAAVPLNDVKRALSDAQQK